MENGAERVSMISEAFDGSTVNRDSVNTLYGNAHYILERESLFRRGYITGNVGGKIGRISEHHATLNLADRNYKAWIASVEGEEKIRFLLLGSDEDPQLSRVTDVLTLTTGGSGSPVLMFSPDDFESTSSANHPVDFKIAHEILFKIKQAKDEAIEYRKNERKNSRRRLIGIASLAGVLYAHNFFDNRLPGWAPASPVELANHIFNRPDHKAETYSDPIDVPAMMTGDMQTIPLAEEYNASGAPRTWNDSTNLGHHDGAKPGTWSVSLDHGVTTDVRLDESLLDEAAANFDTQVDCSDQSGLICIESVKRAIEEVEESATSDCRSLDIDVEPGRTKIFIVDPAGEDQLSYEIPKEGSLTMCSNPGNGYPEIEVYIYNP